MNSLKGYLLALCAIPFILNLSHMFKAWRISTLDRWDWVFLLLFVINAVFHLKRAFSYRRQKNDYFALFLLLPSFAAIILARFVYDINAIAIMTSIVFWWSAFWFLLGWRSAFCMVPSFMLLILSGTSTTYWISYLFMLQASTAITCKFIAAIFFIVWDIFNRSFNLIIRRGTLCFWLAALATLALFIQAKNLNDKSVPFLLDFSELQFGNYIGRSIIVSEDTKRFFAHSKVEQYRFADDDTIYTVLAVECGDDIHEIHPASHCLKTSGATIMKEYPAEYEINGNIVVISGIQASIKGIPILVAVWYSNKDFSTSNFLGFRRTWTPDMHWMTYQVSTPIFDGDVETASKRLRAFLNAIRSNVKFLPPPVTGNPLAD